jgi:hypothetical protein
MRYRFIKFEQNLFKKREGTQELAELEDFNKHCFLQLPLTTMNYSNPFHVSHHDQNNFSRQPHSRLPKTKRPDVFIDRQNARENALLETINSSQSESDLLPPPLLPPKINPRPESLIPRIPHFPFKDHLGNSVTSDLYHVLYLHQAIRLPSCETLSHAPHGASIFRGS